MSKKANQEMLGFVTAVAEYFEGQPILTEDEESLLDNAYKIMEKNGISVPIN